MSAWLALLIPALAGYGDPIDGRPSAEERELHLWTNAVRVDPEAFSVYYTQGGCSFEGFQADEKTPKAPVRLHPGLAEAARFHSQDMHDNGCFSHDSCDGTDWADRISRYYDSGWFSENIAVGYPSPFSSVVHAWMCSPPHRENMMSEQWDELGTGVVGLYYTQNFGWRSVAPRPITMGAHHLDDGRSWLRADFYDPDERAPDRMWVVVNGEAFDMELEYGEPSMGVWLHRVSERAPSCHEYWFRAEVDGEVTHFPADGSYTWGDCDYTPEDDAEAGWVARQLFPHHEDDPLDKGCGCSSGGGGAALGLLVLPVLLARRRLAGADG